MSDAVIVALIGAVVSVLTSGGAFCLVCMFGTKFVVASRELMRDSIVKDYTEFLEGKEIPRLRRESIDRKYAGLCDMRPKIYDPTIEDMYNEIRRWKIKEK